jgi:hypothetical protein
MKQLLSRKSSVNLLVTGLLAVAIVLAVAGAALAAWKDVTPALVATYGVSEADLQGISQGYDDGTWKPQNPMLRKHFIKMAVGAFGVAQANPAVPTFSDVLPSDPYYAYVEGAVAAELTGGVGGGKFAPNAQITREQAVAIIARWLAGEKGVDLAAEYDAESAAAVLAGFSDAGSVSPSLVKEMAYAVDESIVQGSQGLLQPKKVLTRIQGAVMLLRARDAAGPDTSSTTSTTSGPTTTSDSDTTTTTTTSTTTTSSTTTSTTSTTLGPTTTIPISTTTTLVAGATIFGKVLDKNGQPVSGATVKVVYNASDPGYRPPPANSTIGTATADSQGLYRVSTAAVPLGSIVDVSVTASGYTSVLVYGVYDKTAEEVNFANFGAEGGDRRMPVGVEMPPFPFEGLLPG